MLKKCELDERMFISPNIDMVFNEACDRMFFCIQDQANRENASLFPKTLAAVTLPHLGAALHPPPNSQNFFCRKRNHHAPPLKFGLELGGRRRAAPPYEHPILSRENQRSAQSANAVVGEVVYHLRRPVLSRHANRCGHAQSAEDGRTAARRFSPHGHRIRPTLVALPRQSEVVHQRSRQEWGRYKWLSLFYRLTHRQNATPFNRGS